MPFVTFEGVEGCGKSTQLALAAARLRERGHRVVETREPGGTPTGRDGSGRCCSTPHRREIDDVTEWLLIEADRCQHVREVLQPAVASGAFVLCDRYSDSTEAYQRAGRGLDARGRADGRRARARRPGAGPDAALRPRARRRDWRAPGERDGTRVGRFEGAGLSFHRAVREAYLEIARREPDRVVLVRSEPDAAARVRGDLAAPRGALLAVTLAGRRRRRPTGSPASRGRLPGALLLTGSVRRRPRPRGGGAGGLAALPGGRSGAPLRRLPPGGGGPAPGPLRRRARRRADPRRSGSRSHRLRGRAPLRERAAGGHRHARRGAARSRIGQRAPEEPRGAGRASSTGS